MNTSRCVAALAAALATLAIGASAAQAAEFTAASFPAAISGEQSSPKSTSWNFEGGQTAKCDTVGLAGELTKASSSLTLTSGTSTCTSFTFTESTINMNECTLILKVSSGSVDTFAGTFDISCPTGKKITLTGGNCEVKIGAQTGLGPVNYKTNTAATPDEVEATFAMKSEKGFTYEKSKDGLACPLSGTGTKTDGTLTGLVKLKAGKKEGGEAFNMGLK